MKLTGRYAQCASNVYTHFRSFSRLLGLIFAPETTLEKALNILVFAVFQELSLNQISVLKTGEMIGNGYI